MVVVDKWDMWDVVMVDNHDAGVFLPRRRGVWDGDG